MPIIPQGKENIRMNVSAPVPIAGTAEERRAGEAMSSFGKEVAEFGMKMQNAERETNLSLGTAAYNEVADRSVLYAKKNAKPDGSDYLQKMQEYSAAEIEKVNKQYGTDSYVVDKLGEFKTKLDDHMTTVGMITAAGLKEDSIFSKQQDLQDMASNRIFNAAKQGLSDESINNIISSEYASSTMDIDKLKKEGFFLAGSRKEAELREKLPAKIGAGLINGLISSEQEAKALRILGASTENTELPMSPGQARSRGYISAAEEKKLLGSGETYKLNLMDKNKFNMSPELKQVMDGMDPNQKQQLIQNIKARLKTNAEANISDISAQISDSSILAINGKFTDAKADVLRAKINRNNRMTPDARTRANAVLTENVNLSNTISTLKNTHRSRWSDVVQAELAKVPDDENSISEGVRQRMEDKLKKGEESLRAYQDKNGLMAVVQDSEYLQNLQRATADGDPEKIKSFNRAVLEKQKSLGIPPQLLTNTQANSLAANLKSIPDAGTTANAIKQMQEQYGADFPMVLSQIAGKDKQLAVYQPVAYMNAEDITDIVDAVKFSKQYDGQLESKMVTDNAVENATREQTKVFKAAITNLSNDGANLERVENFQNLINVTAKRLIANGTHSSAEDAVEEAYKRVVDREYAIVNSGKSQVLVPRQIDGLSINEKRVSEWLMRRSGVEYDPKSQQLMSRSDGKSYLDDLAVLVPPSYSAMSNPKETYYSHIKQYGRWVMNPAGDGVELRFNDRRVVNIYKEPVTKLYKDM